MTTFYCYSKCSTCKKAEKWLQEHDVSYGKIDLVEQPPTKEQMLNIFSKSNQKLRYFFNTSGIDYRKMGLKDKVEMMTKEQAATLMSKNGKLIKRPLMVDDTKVTCGFNVGVYEENWI
ncbi:arsenate reductase family protein [Pediococcus pentosaceus]|jgi:arsenate reductase|uniref:Arsenate reductase family protein n=3 Tax=Pediococcus pentosaceus TaxID=1255 RepID=A0A379BS73_PEDPE|nr:MULTISPECIES: arsenate reductase family protein [Pediococcus]ABJ68116.1 Arsenate reductase related protein, glutaredoxin family [Pediococcus pentosaceus ATCC 25745]AHA05157.1 arsenate reductase [Pediococcus pentosaceus SL4]ANI97851.1 arsenate reductase [Pediococcus pentosaceus]ASC08374.1 Arsenate reductase (glutaredoxin) [Pediococcus pentosaceus]AVL01562.1 arsenate reductase [Pediococcus pentosaceus]